jgi:hypothetical protein
MIVHFMAKRSTAVKIPAFVVGLVLLFSGIYLFASLASYDPRSVPGWAPIISSVARSVGASPNLGGPLGALLAGYSLFFFGGAAYLLAMVTIGYGLAKWFLPAYRLRDSTERSYSVILSSQAAPAGGRRQRMGRPSSPAAARAPARGEGGTISWMTGNRSGAAEERDESAEFRRRFGMPQQ